MKKSGSGGKLSWARRQRSRAIILVAILALLIGCEDYPKGVKRTQASIQGRVLHVGLVENYPWVIRGASGPEGLEPEIIRELATQLDADIHWHWGSTGVVIQALEQYQLHLAAGGFTAGPRLPSTVAPTKSYYTSRYTIGFPPGMAKAARIEGLAIALPFLSPLHEPLEKKKAKRHVRQTPETSGLPMAGPRWWLEAHGYKPGDWTLLEEKHVMVVTKGENAWINTVQHYLNSLDKLDKKLQQLGSKP